MSEKLMNLKAIFKRRLLITQRFITFVIIHFFKDDCSYRASALAFTSLLAIVPLMSVAFAIWSSFPVFQNYSQPVQNFIFENFVPATGKIVQNYLQQFTAQISQLSIWGVAFLFITALLLMVTIERALNKIWRVMTNRQGVAAFLLFWAILSLTPIFLGLSLAASSLLFSTPYFSAHPLPSFLINMLPCLLSLTGFTFLYVVVPNCPVKLRHGLAGGMVATVLFETAKQGFAFYLTHYNSYQLLYGAFATIPIFFVWVYWVWVITLVGAEVSYAMSISHHGRTRERLLDGFSHALLWLQFLWLKQKKGLGASPNELFESSKRAYAVDRGTMINQLKHINLVYSGENGAFFLSRDLHDVTLFELSQQLPYCLPTSKELDEDIASGELKWQTIFRKNNELLQESLSTNLAELFSPEEEHLATSGETKSADSRS